ncbi:MAG TPA: hypothetical protein VJJ02_04485 [Candidatus Paceibacterota bacterium]
MTPPPIGQLNLHIPVTPILLFSILAILIVLWGVFTIVIRYHWKNYGTGKLEVFTMNFFYFVGSIILIVLMVVFALLYLASVA